MTKIEAALLVSLARVAGSSAFWDTINRLLKKAKSDAARAEIFMLNDKIVATCRWNARGHTHASERLCKHKKTIAGPRIPLRWGSAGSLICTACGAWRRDRPNEKWQPATTLAEALQEDDET